MKNKYKPFAQQILAARLGVPVECLQKNPDFEQFMKKNFLTRIIREVYQHDIQYDSAKNTIMMKFNGQYTSWEEIKKQITLDEKGVLQGWCYLEGGFTKHNMDKWETLIPYKILPESERPKTYQIEIVTDCFREETSDRGTEFEDHTWIRLRKPTGEVYSFGLYPEEILTSSKKHLLATTRGVLKSPDLNEFLPQVLFKTFLKDITEEKFKKIIASAEQSKKENTLTYSIIDHNCTDFALSIASEAEITITSPRISLSKLFPKKIQRFGKIIKKITPKKMKKFFQKRIEHALGRRKFFTENTLDPSRHPQTIYTFSMSHPRKVREWMKLQEHPEKTKSS